MGISIIPNGLHVRTVWRFDIQPLLVSSDNMGTIVERVREPEMESLPLASAKTSSDVFGRIFLCRRRDRWPNSWALLHAVFWLGSRRRI